ncbi:glycosyltransferase [Pelagibacterales bacterium SAG-MED38]|nr:glycosyltransferase [Pelagibacterales bacterium SAG-MED38]MDC3117394.1 glycosyltransferase [Candidatus Pelagibacter sp.]|tara:strand:- start:271 stop:1365 length:1095 start_codon:yes stop_codon:yes gene_type:complete
MDQKRLIIFIPSIEGGGVEKNLFIISNYLKDKVRDISLITISRKFKNKFSSKINFISPQSNFWDRLGRRKKFFVALFLLFIEILKNRNILVFCFQGNIYCTLLCKFLGIKIIVRSNSAPDGWLHNKFKYLIFKFTLGLADRIIVNSLDFKKKFKTKFNIDAECIYNPLNKNEIIKKSNLKNRIKFNKNKLNLINVGRFADQKDQITLLRAINIIKDKINFNLLIVGKGLEKQNLINYINKNNLSDQVRIINFQNNPFNLIKSSEVFVLTSLYEGLPNVLLEAQVLKKFIISSNCPTGPREILLNGKAGSLFKVGDYKKLSDLILDYSKNKKKLSKKIEIGYKNLKRFDYSQNLKRYLKIINSLI